MSHNLVIDENKCIGCGHCVPACPGMLLYVGEDKKAHSKEFTELNWNGCWRCQHHYRIFPYSGRSAGLWNCTS